MTNPQPYRSRIEAKLRAALAPSALSITDESLKHARHRDRMAAAGTDDADHGRAPMDGQGETHFRISVVSTAFAGKTRIERHRMINDLLADELRERVHALTIKARTPDEAG